MATEIMSPYIKDEVLLCVFPPRDSDVAEAESASDTIMKAAAAMAVGTNFGSGCTQPVSLSCRRKNHKAFSGLQLKKVTQSPPFGKKKKAAREKPEVMFYKQKGERKKNRTNPKQVHFAFSILIISSQTDTSATTNKGIFPLAQFKQRSSSFAHIQIIKNHKYNKTNKELIEMKHISQGKKRKRVGGGSGSSSRVPFICPL